MKHKEPIPEGWSRPRPPSYYVKQREAQRRRRALNPERVRELGRNTERRRKLRKYGLTEESYAALWEKQGSACAICYLNKPMARNWHIDHCHSSGKVRGILCHHCNLMLGNARDSVETLTQGIKYLESSYE